MSFVPGQTGSAGFRNETNRVRPAAKRRSGVYASRAAMPFQTFYNSEKNNLSPIVSLALNPTLPQKSSEQLPEAGPSSRNS